MGAIRIIQDNKVNGGELLSVHNPLAFICEVDYDGFTPNNVSVKLSSNDEILVEAKAIVYKDSAPQSRQFIFLADVFIRGSMPDYEDEVQAADTLIAIQNVTKQFTITFEYNGITASTDFVACNASSQFGDPNGACMNDGINMPTIYTAGEGGVVYLYIFNNDSNNLITMDTSLVTSYATNANGDILTNSNNDRILIVI